jgi:ABC-type multidrug transport system fused ATPase/permease subunit
MFAYFAKARWSTFYSPIQIVFFTSIKTFSYIHSRNGLFVWHALYTFPFNLYKHFSAPICLSLSVSFFLHLTIVFLLFFFFLNHHLINYLDWIAWVAIKNQQKQSLFERLMGSMARTGSNKGSLAHHPHSHSHPNSNSEKSTTIANTSGNHQEGNKLVSLTLEVPITTDRSTTANNPPISSR